MTDEAANDDRHYVIDPEEEEKLLKEKYLLENEYKSSEKIKVMSPALFFGIMILVIVTGFGFFIINTFGP